MKGLSAGVGAASRPASTQDKRDRLALLRAESLSLEGELQADELRAKTRASQVQTLAALGCGCCCLPICLSQSARGEPRAGSRPARQRPLNLAPNSTVKPRRCALAVHHSVTLLSQSPPPPAPPQRPFRPTSPPRTSSSSSLLVLQVLEGP